MTSFMNTLKGFLVCLMIVGLAALAAPVTAGAATNTAVTADSGTSCGGGFLTFPAWYRGLTKSGPDGSCDIKSPTEMNGGFKTFIWTIALNLVEILLNVVGYAAVGFIIYGGIKYITSAGSPTGMVSARKTIMNAVIGLIISIVSVAIVKLIAEGTGRAG